MDQRLLNLAMQAPDDVVLRLQYEDSKGQRTTRVVSPIRYLSKDRFLGLCLCRCEPRQFHLERCSQVEMRRAEDYVMPIAMHNAS